MTVLQLRHILDNLHREELDLPVGVCKCDGADHDIFSVYVDKVVIHDRA